MASERPAYGVTASHGTVQAELEDRVDFDQESVLARLKIQDLDATFVEDCRVGLYRFCSEEIAALKKLASSADCVSVADLESEDHLQAPFQAPVAGKKRKGTRREALMYRPLGKIFDYIRNFSQSGQPEGQPRPGETFNRGFARHSSDLIPEQDHTLGFPRFTPDFGLLHDNAIRQGPKDDKRRWRLQDAFVEVKASSQQHPYLDSNGKATPLLTQVANYARLHLSARSFAVFSVSLMIYGSEFCVAIFDHSRGKLSPRMKLWEDSGLRTFIRLVRNMTRVLLDTELGLDPSVHAMDETLETSYLVDPIGDDQRFWLTVGKPYWSSLSLFGRGTTVRPVRQASALGVPTGRIMIMKSSWRSSKRASESVIYKLVKGKHPGLARYLIGGDVVHATRGNAGLYVTQHVTVHSLRGEALRDDEETLFLHRIILDSRGKPIWEYTSGTQLLKGLQSAVSAHKFLWDQGILHRDVSAGNILLSDDPKEQGAVGFLIDIEYARVSPDRLMETRSEETVVASTAYGPIPYRLQGPMIRVTTVYTPLMRGATITGTFQFMSRRLLRRLVRGKKSIETRVADDIESFIWVLIYAVLRHLVITKASIPEGDTEIDATFREVFGGTSVTHILTAREAKMGVVGSLLKQPVIMQGLSIGLRGVLYTYIKQVSSELFVAIRPDKNAVDNYDYRNERFVDFNKTDHGASEDDEEAMDVDSGGDHEGDDGDSADRRSATPEAEVEALSRIYNHEELDRNLQAGVDENDMRARAQSHKKRTGTKK